MEVREGTGDKEKWARLSTDDGFKLDFFIEFNHPAVDGTTQRAHVDFGDVSYVHDVARARTFGFMQDVEMLRGIGLASCRCSRSAAPTPSLRRCTGWRWIPATG